MIIFQLFPYSFPGAPIRLLFAGHFDSQEVLKLRCQTSPLVFQDNFFLRCQKTPIPDKGDHRDGQTQMSDKSVQNIDDPNEPGKLDEQAPDSSDGTLNPDQKAELKSALFAKRTPGSQRSGTSIAKIRTTTIRRQMLPDSGWIRLANNSAGMIHPAMTGPLLNRAASRASIAMDHATAPGRVPPVFFHGPGAPCRSRPEKSPGAK